MQPKFCNKCGNPLSPGDKHCRKCGAPVKIRSDRNNSGVNTAGRNAASAVNIPKNTASIPSFEEVASRFNNQAKQSQQPDTDYGNPEGTVLLAGPTPGARRENESRKAAIMLSLDELLRGCTKVVDFGTGDRYELNIPAGLSPGNRIIVKDTGIKDPDTGDECEFDLTIIMN